MGRRQNTPFPTYSLDKFNSERHKSKPYQVEVFDANRHFEVEYPHAHDFFEILFITKGSGIHVIDQNQYQISPPCIFFLSPGQAHKLELSEDIKGYIFLFTDEFYHLERSNKNRLLELPFFYNLHQENPPLAVPTKDFSYLESLFLKGCEEMVSDSSHSFKLINSVLDLILNSCFALYPQREVILELGKGRILAKQFLQLVEEQYKNNPSIEFIAEQLNVTANHLTQTVKQFTGHTSIQIIKSKQILEAKKMLRYSDMSTAEISDSLCFKDQSYFARFFRKATSYSPRDYRKKNS